MHPSRVISRAILGALILTLLVPTTAMGIARDVVIERGKVWVVKKTPYSQTRWARLDGTLLSKTAKSASTLGYRTDCSGYVSMCLGLTDYYGRPMSLTTRSLSPSQVTTITKDVLLPGDVVLKRGSHVVLFVKWLDSSKKTFKAYEERGTAYGTVETTRTYSEMYGWGYRSFRYKKIDDFYPDTQQAIYGTTAYDTAVAASRVSFPATRTAAVESLVVANGDAWTGNLGAAALAGAGGGPLLVTSKTSLPSATESTIKRLRPGTVYVMGGPSIVSTAVTDRITRLGFRVVRVTGKDRYITTSRAAIKAVGLARAEHRTVDAAYFVNTDAFCDGVSASPVSAKTARPILLTRKTTVPAATLDALKKTGIKRVYVIGSTSVISDSVVKLLKKRGIQVARKSGKTRYDTALAVAQHGAGIRGSGLTWKMVGVSSGTSLDGALMHGVAQGQAGSLLLLTPGSKLYSGASTEIAGQRTGIGKVRVFGSYSVIGLAVRSSIAKLMRAK